MKTVGHQNSLTKCPLAKITRFLLLLKLNFFFMRKKTFLVSILVSNSIEKSNKFFVDLVYPSQFRLAKQRVCLNWDKFILKFGQIHFELRQIHFKIWTNTFCDKCVRGVSLRGERQKLAFVTTLKTGDFSDTPRSEELKGHEYDKTFFLQFQPKLGKWLKFSSFCKK